MFIPISSSKSNQNVLIYNVESYRYFQYQKKNEISSGIGEMLRFVISFLKKNLFTLIVISMLDAFFGISKFDRYNIFWINT